MNYRIPVANWQALQGKLTKLNKKAAKLGTSPIALAQTGEKQSLKAMLLSFKAMRGLLSTLYLSDDEIVTSEEVGAIHSLISALLWSEETRRIVLDAAKAADARLTEEARTGYEDGDL